MSPPRAAEHVLSFARVSGLDMAGTLRMTASMLRHLEAQSTCGLEEILQILGSLSRDALPPRPPKRTKPL